VREHRPRRRERSIEWRDSHANGTRNEFSMKGASNRDVFAIASGDGHGVHMYFSPASRTSGGVRPGRGRMGFLRDHRWTWFGLAGALLLLSWLYLFAALGWPGQLDEAATPARDAPASDVTQFESRSVSKYVYGETVDWEAAIRQPVCTWSNLGAIVAGLALVLLIETRGRAGGNLAANPMRAPSFQSILYSYLVVFLGSGSMYFHASITRWGGIVDNLSMNLYVSFILIYQVARLAGFELETAQSRAIALALLVVANGLFALAIWWWSVSLPIFGVMVAGAVVLESVRVLRSVARPAAGVHFAWWWFVAGLVVFAIAFLIWKLSQSRSSFLWAPDAPMNGHGAWHLLSAVAAVLFFVHFRSETRP
jgi:hypothetical protein